MLDHVFTDAIGALRETLEEARLERLAAEEHFNHDVITGDTSWETVYGLPGEVDPPRARAVIALDWSTWSQSAFRTWVRGDEPDDEPRIDLEITLRLQQPGPLPDMASILAVLPESGARVGTVGLRRTAPTAEVIYADDLTPASHACEVGFRGGYDLDEEALTDGTALDAHFAAIGGWIAAALVRLGDLVPAPDSTR